MSDKREQHREYMKRWRAKRRGEALKREEANKAYWDYMRRIVRQEVAAVLAPLLEGVANNAKV